MKKIISYIYKKCWDIIANPSEHQEKWLISWRITPRELTANLYLSLGSGVMNFKLVVYWLQVEEQDL